MDVRIDTSTPHTLDLSGIPLQLTLLYEDGISLTDQSVLQLVPEGCSSISTGAGGQAIIRFRVNEVSKNHRNQKFVVEIAANISRVIDTPHIISCRSSPILVLSKRKKRRAEQAGLPSVPARSPPAQLGPLGVRAYTILQQCEWQVVGAALDFQTQAPDPAHAIVRCPMCNTICMGTHRAHAQGCELRRMLDECDQALRRDIAAAGLSALSTGNAIAR